MKSKPPPPRPPEGPLTPEEWKAEVWRRAGGRCAVTNRWTPLMAGEAHHAVRKEALRRCKMHDLVWHPDNGVWLALRVHEAHESGARRVPRAKLPASVWRFARIAEERAGDGSEWATVAIERTHPTVNG